MPLQNRVDPYGQLVADPARGAWLGNRGILHNASKQIVSQWQSPRWITCTLSFKGRRREVFALRRYSELFFLDEATAFSAGHRPCAECRRRRFREFREAWIEANSDLGAEPAMGVDSIDRIIHSERTIRGGGKRVYRANLADLPAGTMIQRNGLPHLVWRDALWPWSFTGYGEPASAPPMGEEITVLTPRSIVRAFGLGFRPEVHESAHF